MLRSGMGRKPTGGLLPGVGRHGLAAGRRRRRASHVPQTGGWEMIRHAMQRMVADSSLTMVQKRLVLRLPIDHWRNTRSRLPDRGAHVIA